MAVAAQGRGRWLLSSMLVFFAWSTLMILVRVWAKLHVARWGTDDYFIMAAFLISAMDVGASFWAAQHGYGLSLSEIAPDIQGQIAKALFAQQQFYIAAMGLCKISAAVFLLRLSANKTNSKPGHIVIGITVLWTIVSMVIVALRGSLHSPWATMDGSRDMFFRWLGIDIFGIIIELMIWATAFKLVEGIQINWRKRFSVLAAFAVRLLLIPMIIIRLYYLAPDQNDDPTLTNIIPHIATEVALHFSVFSASVTSLRPFLRTMHLELTVSSYGRSGYGYGPRSAGPSANRSRNQSQPRTYIRLESVSKRTAANQTGNPPPSTSQQELWKNESTAHTTSSSYNNHGPPQQEPDWRRQEESQNAHALDSHSASSESGLVMQRTIDFSIAYENNGSK